MNFLKSRLFRFIASLGVAALFFFLCPPCFNKIYLLVVLALLVLIINLDKYIVKARFLTHLTRIAVGGLFIFSGFIKANDPQGFSYKLQEYFEVFGQGFSCEMKAAQQATSGVCPCVGEGKIDHNAPAPVSESSLKWLWDFFAEHALFLAIVICAIEMLLGIFLLLGWQTRASLWLFLGMIVFFSFLTFYSACCNKVTSCGCFGDAIKLTPWESFWKDLILLILIALLFAGKENIKPITSNSILMATLIGIGGFASFAFPVYTNNHLPVFDFRPYKIGTNLWVESHSKDPATTGCITDSTYYEFYCFRTKDDSLKGNFKMFTMNNYPDSTWHYYCRYDVVVRKGNCGATIMDFNLSDTTGYPMNDSVLTMKGPVFFLVMWDIDQAAREPMGKINLFYDAAQKAGIPFYALVNVGPERIKLFTSETGAKYPFLQVDGTALKTVIRSNPGLMMLRDGVVTDMWHYNDFPEFNDAMNKK